MADSDDAFVVALADLHRRIEALKVGFPEPRYFLALDALGRAAALVAGIITASGKQPPPDDLTEALRRAEVSQRR